MQGTMELSPHPNHIRVRSVHISWPYPDRWSCQSMFPLVRLALVVFLVLSATPLSTLLSDVQGVLCVELFFLAPTVSGNGAGVHVCVPLPPSTPRSGDITVVQSVLVLYSPSVNCLVRWIIVRIGKVGREGETFVTFKLKLSWLSRSMILALVTFPWLSRSVMHPKTSLKGLVW